MSDSDVDSNDSYIPGDVADLADFEPELVSGFVADDDELLLQELHVPTSSQRPVPMNETLHTTSDDESESSDEVPLRRKRACIQPNLTDSDSESSDGGEYGTSTRAPEVCFYKGKKNCFTWSSQAVLSTSQTRARNVISVRINKIIGPALLIGDNPTPEQVWSLFFTNTMLEKIVLHTNAKLVSVRAKLKNSYNPYYKDVTTSEMKAFLGIVVLCAIFKSNRESLESVFSNSVSGRPIFWGIMTVNRCRVITRNIRFDNSNTREERLKHNQGAAISELFEDLVQNFQSVYSPGAHLTADETLVPFRGRVKFLVYNPKKPAKYGMKIMGLADSHTAYICNAYMYVGKGSDGATLPQSEKKLLIPTQSVLRLVQPYVATNRNITCDNWFISIELAEELLKRLPTVVGTMKKNKPQIPPEFQPSNARAVSSCLYGYTADLTLISYVPKKKVQWYFCLQCTTMNSQILPT